MHNEHPHPLLAQVPLTVSPFLSLPTATPLPYTYKQLPSTLPPSMLSSPPSNPQNSFDHQNLAQDSSQLQQPAYIHSNTGATAHPDQILTSCLALQSHLHSLEQNARNTLREFEEKKKAAELAEKRRVAPGWLDGDVKMLKPENVNEGDSVMAGVDGGQGRGGAEGEGQRRTSVGIKTLVERRDGVLDEREGEALDRAFGGLDIK